MGGREEGSLGEKTEVEEIVISCLGADEWKLEIRDCFISCLPLEPFDLKQCQKELHSFYRTICKVKIIPWKPKSAVCINEIYTKLSWQREESKPSEDSQEELEDYTDMFKSCGPYDEPNRLLVFGPPGIGKTTFAKRVVFDWLHQAKEILK